MNDIERFAKVVSMLNGGRRLTRLQLAVAYFSTVQNLTAPQLAARRGTARRAVTAQRAAVARKLGFDRARDCFWELHAAYWRQVGYEEGQASMDRVKVA